MLSLTQSYEYCETRVGAGDTSESFRELFALKLFSRFGSFLRVFWGA